MTDLSNGQFEDNAFAHRQRAEFNQPIFEAAVDPHRDPEILRGRRYTRAVEAGWHVDASKWVDVAVHAVMAVADDEQAELRAEVRTYHDRAMASEAAESGWQVRAEDAEAKVAQARTLLDEGEMIWPDAPEWAVDGVREFTERIRVALDGDA